MFPFQAYLIRFNFKEPNSTTSMGGNRRPMLLLSRFSTICNEYHQHRRASVCVLEGGGGGWSLHPVPIPSIFHLIPVAIQQRRLCTGQWPSSKDDFGLVSYMDQIYIDTKP
jgi:hypothetical protein